MAKNKNVGKPRNYTLASGVYRFSKSKTFHKKAIHKFLKKTTPKKTSTVKPAFIEKKITGQRNGSSRKVRVKRLRNDYPTVDAVVKSQSSSYFAIHKRKLRASLTPGTIAIVLAGIHKGKRVIVCKQLPSGLILITGPYSLNGCPLRRINQRYLLATSTRIDVSLNDLPSVDENMFRRLKASKKPTEGDIYEAKKEEYKPSTQRKELQVSCDAKILAAIKKHPEGLFVKQYLRHTFSLSKGQYPHNMCF